MMSSAPVTVEPLLKNREGILKAELLCPPDKSVTHRSIIFAAMAAGESVIEHPLLGADCRSTIAIMQALGATIEQPSTEQLIVRSPGVHKWQSPTSVLDFGNSGTTARLLTGLFASRPGLFVVCCGDASLSQRPMQRVVTPLRAAGAMILGRSGGEYLPLAIEGRSLTAVQHTITKASAQIKSALIFSALNIPGQTTVTLPTGSRDHTELMLAALGAPISVEKSANTERITIKGPFQPPAGQFVVPGDPSSAAFFCVLGVLIKEGHLIIKNVLDNATRLGFLEVLAQMGARIEKSPLPSKPGQLEPVVNLVIEAGYPLQGVDVSAAMAPRLIDEVPILAVAAAFAKGTTRLRGLAELRVKESDRLLKTAELVTAMGAKATIEGDDLIIEGGLATAKALNFDPAFDHRLAMAAVIAACFADSPSKIHDPSCVDVSFPGFFDLVGALR